MSKRPKRSRAEQRTPTVIQVPGVALAQAADGSGIVAVEIDDPAAAPIEMGAPFDEELPALHAEVLAAVEKLASSLDAGLRAGALPLPAWWPEDADRQAALVAACDAFNLGYNEINGARFDGSTLVLVTIGGSKVRWPEDVGKVTLTDMQRGRPHEHTEAGRQFPNGYLRRDPRRDPKE